MQKSLLTVLFLFLSIVLLPSCDGSSVGPVIELESDVYDFGVVRTDGISEAKFKIFNRGDKPLKVYDVVSSCSCTTGEFLDKQIPPGGEGELVIRVNPNKMKGVGTRIPLGIKTNDPAQEIIKLPVYALREYPLRFITEMEHVSEMTVVPILFGRINGTVGHQVIQKGVPTEITIRAVQHNNKFINILEMTDTPHLFDEGVIDVQSKIGSTPPETWGDPEIKEFDMVFKFTPKVAPGEYQVILNLNTSIRRYVTFHLIFDFTVVESDKFILPAASEPVPIVSMENELPISKIALRMVSIIKESESSYAVRIATDTSERWYNEGAEFEGYVLEKIYYVQQSVVVRELATGRRLRVSRKDAESSTVTIIP